MTNDSEPLETARPDHAITLVGLMGAGKSTIGRRLASRLTMEFADADVEIERAADPHLTRPVVGGQDGEDMVLRLPDLEPGQGIDIELAAADQRIEGLDFRVPAFALQAHGAQSLARMGVGDGGAGADTLAGSALANTFAVTTADDATVSAGTGSLSVDDVQNLTGGGLADTFNLAADVTGTVAGAADNDIFNFNAGAVSGT